MPKTRIKTVIDTSILVSALKTKDEKRSPAWLILDYLKSKSLQNYISNEIIEEMEITLFSVALKFSCKPEYLDIIGKAHEILQIIRGHSKKITSKVDFSKDKAIKEKLEDDSDLKFLEVLYTAKAKHLITQNTKHFGNFVIEKNKKNRQSKT